MSRRFLRGGLLSAALFGATALAPLAAAKPPDLPAEVKNVATPVVVSDEGLMPLPPPAADVNQAGNTVPAAGLVMPQPVEEPDPIFYRLHLADRKMMTSCLLFGVHPLLAFTEPERILYLPQEIRESLEEASSAPQTPAAIVPISGSVSRPTGAGALIGAGLGIVIGVAESNTGSLMFGVGVNSDAGLTGNIVVTGANFLNQYKPHGVIGGTATIGFLTIDLNIQVVAAPPAVSVCPRLQQQAVPAPVTFEKERTVLDNLNALEESDRLFQAAQEMLRTGRVCEALDFFEKISRLCPGSRYEEMAQAVVAEVFKHFPGATEEAEEGAKQKAIEESFDGWKRCFKIFFPFIKSNSSDSSGRVSELLRTSEDSGLLPIHPEWEWFWFLDQPAAPPTYDRIHGDVQYKEEEEIADEPSSPEVFGTPLSLILSDLLTGQGLNLYPEKPAAPAAEEEEQELSPQEAKHQEIDRHLNMLVTHQFKNIPLMDVLEEMHDRYGLKIAIDKKALAHKGIDASRLVSIKLEQMPLKSALRLLLNNVGLSYVVKDDVVQISAPGSCTRTVGNLNIGVEPGSRVMADGLLKAARLALEGGRYEQATDFARQAYALDPVRMREDDSLYSLYLLVEQPAGRRINNQPAGVAGEPSIRPNLPGVDPRVVAAMEKVLGEFETTKPRLEIVVEEEQEPRVPATSTEIVEPFVLGATRAVKAYGCAKDVCGARQLMGCVCDVVAPGHCVEMLKEIADFRVGVLLTERGPTAGKMLSFGLLGWSVTDVPGAADEDE